MIVLFIFPAAPQLYLFGGHIDFDRPNSALLDLANSTARQPIPGGCTLDWASTVCPRVAVVTSASENSEAGNEVYEMDDSGFSYKLNFLRLGLSPAHISAHCDNFQQHTNPNSPAGKANLILLLQADIVFFNGGDQSRHIRTWMLDNATRGPILAALLDRKDVVLAGTSAGLDTWNTLTFGDGTNYGHIFYANSAGLASKSVRDGVEGGSGLKDTRFGNDSLQYKENGGTMPGFQLLPRQVVVDAHFDSFGRIIRFVSALRNMSARAGVGVDQNTCLKLVGQKGTVLGSSNVIVIDIQEATFPQSKFFSARGVVVHLLRDGDSLDLFMLRPSTTRQLIAKPQFINPTNSEDIGEGGQCGLLLARLVDQVPPSNLGKAQTPKDFSGGPSFQFLFERTGRTQGFRGTDGSVTAINVGLRISNDLE